MADDGKPPKKGDSSESYKFYRVRGLKSKTSIPPDDPLEEARGFRTYQQSNNSRVKDSANLEYLPLPPPEGWFQSVEELLTSEDGFGLDEATPLQRAICKIIQGKPFANKEGHLKSVRRALGGRSWVTERQQKKAMDRWSKSKKARHTSLYHSGFVQEIVIIAAIRSGKSLLAAVTAIWASQTVRVQHLAKGEIPRFLIFSLSLDNARAVIQHIATALGSPKLRPLLLTKKEIRAWDEFHPWRLALEESTDDTVVGRFVLQHPSGRPMEIRVVAGKRAGASGLSRWLFGVCADEATRMHGATDAVVNYEHMRDAVQGRLLPGAQFLTIGSPWQSDGPVYEMFQSEFGRRSKERVILVAAGPDMNPSWWTPERCRALKARNPQAYITDVLGRFADAEAGLIPAAAIEACTRKHPMIIEFEPGHDYRAAMDPATRTNAWTLVVADCVRRPLPVGKDDNKEIIFRKMKRIVFHCQWQGTSDAPLSPKAVLAEAAAILKEYHLDWCYTDQWAADHNVEIAADQGLALVVDEWTAQNKQQLALNLAAQFLDGNIEIPNDPILRRDLRLIKKKPIQKGIQIVLPQTPDRRHCDYFPPMMKALNEWIREDMEPEITQDDANYQNHLDQQEEQREADELEHGNESLIYPYGADDTRIIEEPSLYEQLTGAFH